MSPLTPLLRSVRRRMLVVAWVENCAAGFLAAAALSCVWLVVSRFFPLLPDAAWASLVLVGLGLIAGTVRTWLGREDLTGTAMAVDARLGTRERFTSSYVFQTLGNAGAEASPMVEAVHRDAERHMHQVRPHRDFPFRVTSSMRWLALPLLLFGLGYVVLPEFDLFGQRERALQAKAREETRVLQAKKLEEVARVLKDSSEAPAEDFEGAPRDIERLAEELRKGRITEKQAFAKVNSLTRELLEERKALERKQQEAPRPALSTQSSYQPMRDIANDLRNGRMSEAASKLRELREKLEKGELSEKEKKALAEAMKEMAKDMGMNPRRGGEQDPASAQPENESSAQDGANEDPDAGDPQTQQENAQEQAPMSASELAQMMKEMEQSTEDMKQALQQMAKLESAAMQLGQWQNEMMGETSFCRTCGSHMSDKQCKGMGMCKSCQGQYFGQGGGTGQGPGMGGGGRGRGNEVGELPEGPVDFSPTVLPGELTDGKMLADILQRAKPTEDGEEAITQYVEGAFIPARQEAEQALTQEEIPRASREFVRQYFGAIEDGETE